MKLLEELQALKESLSEELAKFVENDPELLAAMGLLLPIIIILDSNHSHLFTLLQTERDTKRAMEGANRWTDNIYTIRKYCETHFNMLGSEFDQAFQIPEDFDYMQ